MIGPGLAMGLGIGLGVWLAAPWPVSALSDTSQIITGGGRIIQNDPDGVTTRYFVLGTARHSGQEAEVQIPLFRGTLRGLRVNLVTDNDPASGSFVLTVRKDGADTNLSCTLTKPGICTDNSRVGFGNGALLSIQTVTSFQFQNVTNTAFTYILQYD